MILPAGGMMPVLQRVSLTRIRRRGQIAISDGQKRREGEVDRLKVRPTLFRLAFHEDGSADKPQDQGEEAVHKFSAMSHPRNSQTYSEVESEK